MADAKPIIRLSPERWCLLRAHFEAMRYSNTAPLNAIECTLVAPLQVGDIVFLPGRYVGPDDADPMPSEPPAPPVKPRPAPAYF